jgi:hypothetical protein
VIPDATPRTGSWIRGAVLYDQTWPAQRPRPPSASRRLVGRPPHNRMHTTAQEEVTRPCPSGLARRQSATPERTAGEDSSRQRSWLNPAIQSSRECHANRRDCGVVTSGRGPDLHRSRSACGYHRAWSRNVTSEDAFSARLPLGIVPAPRRLRALLVRHNSRVAAAAATAGCCRGRAAAAPPPAPRCHCRTQ